MIEIPDGLAASLREYGEESARALLAELPGRAARFLERWDLRVAGPSMHGRVSLVLPVTRADGTPAVLKLQQVDEETAGEWLALRTWDGDGAARLLAHDEATGTLLLERLRPGTQLASLPDGRAAVRVLAGVLARLSAVPAPPGLRRLGDVLADTLAALPGALAGPVDEEGRRLLRECVAAVREVADEPGDRLLHWDLHYENVLAARREPWLAIDPKPLAGDPGFELLPALWNRFDPAEVRWRFDLLTEALGLDRERARAWTLGRVLQSGVWEAEDGETRLDPERTFIGWTLLAR
ncbi:aminoglycoside phosphotransferase family protein [Streptomyces sp. NPDC005805]|uniref:aminoglycoside phosphotransferase family protein n=1 Tax=Streptomyces sp. NPDC005805 TaxID=3157068 RepID=UPI0033F76215